jgi:hypothetical protein
MGRFVPEADDGNIRELLFYNYRIIYRFETDRILVLTIIHGCHCEGAVSDCGNLHFLIPKHSMLYTIRYRIHHL